MDGDQNSDTHISMEIVLDKLSSMESRMEDNFSNLHEQIAALNSEFKEELNGVKVTIKELEKSLNNAWAFIEDIQSEAKALKDSKSSQQQMLEELAGQIKTLEANLTNLVRRLIICDQLLLRLSKTSLPSKITQDARIYALWTFLNQEAKIAKTLSTT